MCSQINVRLYPSLGAGLIASTPWITLLLSALTVGLASSAPLLLCCPPALAGAVWQVRASGLLMSSASVTQLSIRDGQLHALLGNGQRFPAHAKTESRLFGRMALLKLALVGTNLTPPLVVLIDVRRADGQPRNTDPDAFRRLRVWLRLSKVNTVR
ncbi:hypothetical protein [Marinobacter caseinilyticus]|uniref:hypothetical protein n=1 Tax=Marinobacter caseinilyticus TaxID=2692195 RepID=UPI0014095CC8|nr:hypothetical protein [Marinobacter caseinilyticus]